jgi:hypothetical protein
VEKNLFSIITHLNKEKSNIFLLEFFYRLSLKSSFDDGVTFYFVVTSGDGKIDGFQIGKETQVALITP